jgi:quercetin dioxygenase-like cupin family protein
MATFTHIDEIEPQEIIPGFHGRLVHTDNVTFAHWDIEAGSVLPEHHHVHEQVTRLMAGTFELTIGGETHRLQPGDMAVIPSNEPHSGRAVTDCVIIEVFQPARDEYR